MFAMSAISQLTVRLPEEIHTKLRVIAAYKNQSINTMLVTALRDVVAQWEQKYGTVVIPEE
jgi:predicted HicB family RNase H-like nuclease